MIKIYLFPRILNSWTYFITKLIISLFSLYNYKLQIRNNFVICNFDTANNFNEYFIGINFQDLNKKLSYFLHSYLFFIRSLNPRTKTIKNISTCIHFSFYPIFFFLPNLHRTKWWNGNYRKTPNNFFDNCYVIPRSPFPSP